MPGVLHLRLAGSVDARLAPAGLECLIRLRHSALLKCEVTRFVPHRCYHCARSGLPVITRSLPCMVPLLIFPSPCLHNTFILKPSGSARSPCAGECSPRPACRGVFNSSCLTKVDALLALGIAAIVSSAHPGADTLRTVTRLQRVQALGGAKTHGDPARCGSHQAQRLIARPMSRPASAHGIRGRRRRGGSRPLIQTAPTCAR